MTTLVDDFNRGDTTSGLGAIPGSALVWEDVLGVARISNQRPVFTGTVNRRAAAVVNVGGNDVDITIQAGGGDAVYTRWVDPQNWVSARIRRYTTTGTGSRTEYEWYGAYGSGVGWLTQRTGSPATHNHVDDGRNTWSSSSTACPHAGSYRHTHTVYDEVGVPFDISHEHGRISCVLTGDTRQVPTSSSVTRYQLIVEESVGGVVTTLTTVAIATPSSLRVRVQGSTLQAFFNGSPGAAATVNTTVHRGATRHGFGLGPSDVEASALDAVTIDTLNDAPYAPTLLFPIDNPVDRTAPVTFRWQHNDPNIGDSQAGFELRLRHETWSEWGAPGGGNSSYGLYELPAARLAGGRWGWTVRTRDQGGRWGPWAAEQFFVAATPVTTHTITAPGAGEVIGAQERLVEWSSPDQDAYRLEVLSAVASGVPGSTVYFDSEWTFDPSARSRVLPFTINGVMVAIRLRVMTDGLESAPVLSFHSVSWLGPREPVAMLDIDNPEGAITITAADPAPFGDHPAVVDHHLEVRTASGVVDGAPIFDGEWSRWRLRPTQTVPANGSYVFQDNAHGEHYQFRWVAVGVNGTTSFGEPVSEQWQEPVTYAFDPAVFDTSVFDVGEVGGADQPDPPSTGFGVEPFGTSPFGGSA